MKSIEEKSEVISVYINGTEYECHKGIYVGELLRTVGLWYMPCGGHGRCGKCRVTITGDISPIDEAEKRMLSPDDIEKNIRLACRVKVQGICYILINNNENSQIRTDGILPYVELKKAFSEYGVAVDIGTTTLAAHLYDRNGTLAATVSRLNPQSVWGADVISRMEAAINGSAFRIATITRSAIDGMIIELCSVAGISAKEIDGIVITGNTVMLHLLTNTDVEPLTHAPFEVKRLFGEKLKANELDILSVEPDTDIYLPPCIGAFVGADTVTAVLASELRKNNSTAILCDIGTNGEMVLWHNQKLCACSTAAGPAFEGAGISKGMCGKAGAIDHVWIVNDQIFTHVIGETKPIGLCGSGLVDAVACLLETQILDETGFLEESPAVIAESVTINQSDIRTVQLSKSAIHAGMRTLMHAEKISCDQVSVLYIAGGFGSYLNVENAGRIGMIPDELTNRVKVIGNAALSGAAMLLLNTDLRKEAENMASKAIIVDLATNPVFASAYMECMMF